MTNPNEFQHDVFLGHSAKDTAAAPSSSKTVTDWLVAHTEAGYNLIIVL